MPYTYNPKSDTLRRMPRRKTRRRRKPRAKSRPALPLSGFPLQKMVKLRYVDELRLVSNVGSSNTYSVPFTANGMFDPYFPLGGHQPKGFDQWMAVYNHYNVVGAKINVKCVSTHDNNCCWGVTLTPETGTMSNLSLTEALENRYNKGAKYISWNNGTTATNNNRPITCTYSQKKQFGKNATSKDSLTGTATSNPTERSFFEVWMGKIQTDTGVKTLDFVVTIDYIALFTEPRVLAQS